MTSTTPDNRDWLNKLSGFPGNAVLGLARSATGSDNKRANQLYLAWTGAVGSGFKQPQVQWIALGMSLEWGGGGNYENHVAGFWGDFVVYQTTNSNVGTARFGDYVTIRQNTADPKKFDAFGYGLNQSTPPGNPISDVHYIVFSR